MPDTPPDLSVFSDMLTNPQEIPRIPNTPSAQPQIPTMAGRRPNVVEFVGQMVKPQAHLDPNAAAPRPPSRLDAFESFLGNFLQSFASGMSQPTGGQAMGAAIQAPYQNDMAQFGLQQQVNNQQSLERERDSQARLRTAQAEAIGEQVTLPNGMTVPRSLAEKMLPSTIQGQTARDVAGIGAQSREKVAGIQANTATANRQATDNRQDQRIASAEKIAKMRMEISKQGLSMAGSYVPLVSPLTGEVQAAWNPKTQQVAMLPNELTGMSRGALSPSIRTMRTATVKLNEDIKKVKEIFKRRPDLVGFVEGNALKVASKTIGTDQDGAELLAAVARMIDNELRIRSGAQIGQYEYPRMEQFLPTVTSPDENFRVKLDQLEEQLRIGAETNGVNLDSPTGTGTPTAPQPSGPAKRRLKF